MNIEVNYISVLAAGVISMVLGFLWYSPMVLGKPWMKERGMSMEDLKKSQKEMRNWYIFSFVLSLVEAYVLFHITTLSINFFHYPKLQSALTSAFWVWLGFVFTTQATAAIFGNKNWKLLGIETGYQLVSLLGMGIAIGSL